MKKSFVLGIFFLTIIFSSCESESDSYFDNAYKPAEPKSSPTKSNNSDESPSQGEQINTPPKSSISKKKIILKKDENNSMGGNGKNELGHVVINGKAYMDQIVLVINNNSYWTVEINDEIPVNGTTSLSQQFKSWLKDQELNESILSSNCESKIISGKNVRIHSFKFKPGVIVNVIDKKEIR